MFNIVLRLYIDPAKRDRYLEFFLVQKELDDFVSQWEGKLLPMSCEMFAEKICRWAMSRYRLQGCEVKVMEDKENFATYSEMLEGV